LWKTTIAKALTKGLAVEQLGDEVRRALMSSDVVNDQNVGMIEGAGRAGLLLEALQADRIGCERTGENLDCDLAIQAGIAGAIHFAHATSADWRMDLIGS
jgi:hypothetical protein